MLELPEALHLAAQLTAAVVGKTVRRVLPPTKLHRFCWFNGDPAAYDTALAGHTVVSAEGFGIFAELGFENGLRLCINDGVNVRLTSGADAPKAYQLLIEFQDGAALAFTVAMYGGIYLHDGSYDNEYYLKSRGALSPFSPAFAAYYKETLAKCKPNISAKAFLATEQRFPGLGNGVLQDILFVAQVHPKRKLSALDETQTEALLESIPSVLRRMTDLGGRDTERGLFGEPGGYRTLMSKNTLAAGCPICGGPITKETYLGGSVYYCASCQPLV